MSIQSFAFATFKDLDEGEQFLLAVDSMGDEGCQVPTICTKRDDDDKWSEEHFGANAEVVGGDRYDRNTGYFVSDDHPVTRVVIE